MCWISRLIKDEHRFFVGDYLKVGLSSFISAARVYFDNNMWVLGLLVMGLLLASYYGACPFIGEVVI